MNRFKQVRPLFWTILLSMTFFYACDNKEDLADAYGNFESRDQLVSPENSGKLVVFNVEEGQILLAGEIVGLVDTTPLFLKKKQIIASISAIKGKLQDPGPQTDLVKKQINVLEKEKLRVENLLNKEAATQKQLDDIVGQLDILKQKIITTEEQSRLANRALLSQIAPLKAQIESIDDQIKRCKIVNPSNGTVLLKLAERGEMVSPLKPLYKMADVSSMELRAYISGDQLSEIALGQAVWLEIDQNREDNIRLEGKISWISDRAEFTPKMIQTKEERVNLVYAFKVVAENPEGILKIGMPGEVHFKEDNREE